MANENGYPIADKFKLNPAKGWFNRNAKRLEGAPTSRHGLHAVLDINGQFELVPPGTSLQSADGLAEATEVIFVDLHANAGRGKCCVGV